MTSLFLRGSVEKEDEKQESEGDIDQEQSGEEDQEQGYMEDKD